MADVYTVPTYSYCENTLEVQGPRGTTIDVTGLLGLPVLLVPFYSSRLVSGFPLQILAAHTVYSLSWFIFLFFRP